METKRLHISKTGSLDVEFVESEALERFDELACEAISECRKSIMMALRYLNAALWHLPPERAVLARTLATNGAALRYDPERVVARYREGESELVRDILHAVLHCAFHHPFETRHGEYAAWSLACDIAVEASVIELAGERFPSKGDDERLAAAERLARSARSLTAQALYQILRSGGPGEALYADHGLTDRDIDGLASLFCRDAHDLWAVHPRLDDAPAAEAQASEQVPDLQNGGGGTASQGISAGDLPDAPDSEEEKRACPDADGGTPGPASKADETGDEEAQRGEGRAEAEEAWRKISKQVEVEMKAALHSLAGDGSLLQNLRVANRKPANYGAFLRRFATCAEDMRVSDEEFDYVYYTYGLARYGNIPLVEPLEYRESNRVREFVIALDTSGSCAGELIRAFVERTYAILRQQASFGDDVNVHLVQCDNRVRTATKVTSLRQIEDYAESFRVSGGGGTDFRPVFDYVDALVADGEFSDLRGMVYFTDGYGAFPAKAPDYEVAFVFVDCDDETARVPAWAMKVMMTQDEVLEKS